jgi:hypothetical protein
MKACEFRFELTERLKRHEADVLLHIIRSGKEPVALTGGEILCESERFAQDVRTPVGQVVLLLLPHSVELFLFGFDGAHPRDSALAHQPDGSRKISEEPGSPVASFTGARAPHDSRHRLEFWVHTALPCNRMPFGRRRTLGKDTFSRNDDS